MKAQTINDRIKDNNNKRIESLFAREETYWLTSAVATEFTLQTLRGDAEEDVSVAAVERFNDTLRMGAVQDEDLEDAKQQTLDNLAQIREWNNQVCVFDYDKAFKLCSGFSSYWMFTKLIEVEWQKVLNQETLVETYQFLDGVLADRAEQEQIEGKYRAGEALLDDEVIFLRSHWEAARIFFNRMEVDMRLLHRGIIPFITWEEDEKNDTA